MSIFLLGSVLSPVTDKRPHFRGGSGTGLWLTALGGASTSVLCALWLLVALVTARPTDQGMKIEPKMPVVGTTSKVGGRTPGPSIGHPPEVLFTLSQLWVPSRP